MGPCSLVPVVPLLAACAALPSEEWVVETSQPERWTEARQAFHQAWFERADDLFAELRREDPDFSLGWGYGAMVDSLLFRDVEERARRAMELAATAPECERLMTTALATFARGELEGSEESLVAFLELYPDDRFARHMLGFTRIDRGRPAAGVEVLRALLVDHPSYGSAYNHLGYGLAALGRHDEALQAFESFLAATPGNPSAHDSVADGLAQLGRIDEAVAHLTRSVLLEPRFAYGWMHLGDVLRGAGEVHVAKRAYLQALDSAELYGAGFSSAVEGRLEELRKAN